MKILLVLALVAGLAAAWWFGIAHPPVERAYKAWVEAVVAKDLAKAKSLSTMDDREITEQRDAIVESVPMQSLSGLHVDVQSRTKVDDATAIDSVVVVFFNPPGVESAFGGALAASWRQHATLVKVDGAWKVREAATTFLAVRDTRHPDRDVMGTTAPAGQR
jgi:hypothetical protein